MRSTLKLAAAAAAILVALVVAACVARGPNAVARHLWWSGFGPVLPHETFPTDCSLCHIGEDWRSLRADFQFDHASETGYELVGAHASAACLRCHNDRGPAGDFSARGCVGCHENVHVEQLGASCEDCHQQWTWRPEGQVELHRRTRFPLVGVHAVTSCQRCHVGAELGRFGPLDVECVACHLDEARRAQFPDHVALGLLDRCDRCHQPRSWNEAETGN